MLDELLELFERDKKSSEKSRSGVRGRLSSLLGDDRSRHDDDRHDDDDDRRSSSRRSRSSDRFDFGD